jgi:hypothetical protein
MSLRIFVNSQHKTIIKFIAANANIQPKYRIYLLNPTWQIIAQGLNRFAVVALRPTS